MDLEIRTPESVTASKPSSYESAESRLTADLTENDNAIEQDLARIIDRWPSLPTHVKAAILMLTGGDENE